MRLKHEIRDERRAFSHRLVDLDESDKAATTKWVGHRTPAVWHTTNRGHFVAVTDYFKGSKEFPAAGIYYCFSLPEVDPMPAEFRMAIGVHDLLDNYLESILDMEDPDKARRLTAFDRLVSFHSMVGEQIKRYKHEMAHGRKVTDIDLERPLCP